MKTVMVYLLSWALAFFPAFSFAGPGFFRADSMEKYRSTNPFAAQVVHGAKSRPFGDRLQGRNGHHIDLLYDSFDRISVMQFWLRKKK